MENDNYLIHNHITDKYQKYNIQHIKKYHPITDTTNTYKQTGKVEDTPSTEKLTALPSPTPMTMPPQHITSPKPSPRIGGRVKVFWPDYNKWYTGTIVNNSNQADGGTHDIQYDDEPDKEPISETLVGKGQVQWEVLPEGDRTVHA